MKSVLLHCCCAHCTAYTVSYWRGLGYDVHGLWYNPNIHPHQEHEHRLAGMRELAERLDFPLTVLSGYEMAEYFRRVAGSESDRCRHCFELRLERTASVARGQGHGAFTSTLLISPHQKHELIQQTGKKVGAEGGVSFLYADLRKRYSDSRHVTKPMELYRQQYCGCLYSEWERFSGAEETP